VLAGGDVAPPVAPGHRYLQHWNQFTSGEGAPGFEIVWLPYYELLNLGASLGIAEETVQRLFASLLFAGGTAAVVYLAFGFVRSSLGAGAAGLLAVFNAHHMTSWTPIPLAAMALAAVLGGMVARAALRTSRRPSALAFALVSAGCGFAFVNPPHLLLVAAWVGACAVAAGAVGGRRAFRAAGSFLLRASPLVLAFNVWWIVPAAMALLGPHFGERFAASTVEQWQWTHRRASIPNVLALNAQWSWPFPEYHPFSARLARWPFDLFKFFPPLLALVGAVLARGRDRRLALALVATGLVLVLVAKGLHPPFRWVNAFLYDHLPGFWLLREPQKVLLLLVLVYAILGALAVERLTRRALSRTPAAWGLAALLVGGALAYAHPMLTGEVMADERPILPPPHVRVPDGWREAGAYLNAQPLEGKVLILPRNDFYQLPTTWGYYGVPFSRTLIHRPVIEFLPGGYFSSATSVRSAVALIEDDLLAANGRPVARQLEALGVRYVLLRRDIDRRFPARSFTHPVALSHGLDGVPGLRFLRSFGVVDLYRFGGERAREVFAAEPVAYRGHRRWIPHALELEPQAALVTADSGDAALTRLSGPGLRVFRSQRGLWEASAAFEGRDLAIRLADPLTLTLERRPLAPLAPRVVRFAAPGPPFALTIGARVYEVDGRFEGTRRLGREHLGANTAVALWRLRPGAERLQAVEAGPLVDCAQSRAARSFEELGLSRRILERGRSDVIRLAARASTACVAFPIGVGDFGAPVRLSLDYRRVKHSPPRICLWQYGPERCARLPALEAGLGWRRLDAVVAPEPGTVGLRLFLYADGGGGDATVAEYRNVALRRYRLVERRPLPTLPLAQVGVAPNSPTTGLGGVLRPAEQQAVLDPDAMSPVGDCARTDGREPADRGLTVERRGSGIRLTAPEHSACVFFPFEPFEPDAAYRVRFDYRRVSGVMPPRACLWQDGINQCAPIDPLDDTSGWRRFDAVVTPDQGAVALRLFVYADAAEDSATVTEYRRFEAAPLLSAALLGEPRRVRLPSVTYERVSPNEFRARVTGATEPFLLALTESHDPGWRVESPGRDASELEHVRVNGYANGWLVPWTGSYEVRLFYEPERYARLARRTSLALLPLGLLVLLARRLLPRLRRRGRALPGHGPA
jgi:arabinofuranan 3-O-arabinosyltransferase